MALLAWLLPFTFTLLTVSEHCSGDSCPKPARGSELLQRSQKQVLKAEQAENRLLSYEELHAQVEASFARAKQLSSRTRLLVESNFKSFHSSNYKSFSKDLTCMENCEQGFDHFAERTGLIHELNATEQKAFRDRVLEEMEIMCKHDKIDDIADGRIQAAEYMQDFMQVLEDERPVLTERLEEILEEHYHDVAFEFADWLMNFSQIDLRHRTGIEESHQNRTLLLETSHSIVERMRKRSLPANFDARTHWPQCSEIIGRIHNQGLFSGPSAQISRGFITSCTYTGGRDGCQGGWPSDVFKLLALLWARCRHGPLHLELLSASLPHRVLEPDILQDLAYGPLQTWPLHALRPDAPAPSPAHNGISASP